MTRKMDGFHQVITVERFLSLQRDGQVILMIQNLHMTKQNTSCGSLTSMLAMLLQWSKLNRRKTILDKVTASDIAYTILVYENTK